MTRGATSAFVEFSDAALGHAKGGLGFGVQVLSDVQG